MEVREKMHPLSAHCVCGCWATRGRAVSRSGILVVVLVVVVVVVLEVGYKYEYLGNTVVSTDAGSPELRISDPAF